MGVIFLTDQFLPNNIPNAFPSMPTLEPRDDSNLTEIRHYDYRVYHNGAWYGMVALAFFLLVVCSLLAGLTLAVCGLDMTLVQLKTVSGSAKQRKQAVVVASLKRRGTWMLCSLIICSVACGESLPIMIQSLWSGREQWVPVLIATLLVAIFAEILPQYLIPKRAIAWGYYCWPVIWGCMWFTAIISYPLSWLLDHLTGSSCHHAIFANEDIAELLKYHERSQKHGGTLGQDTVRIMLGALQLDSCKVHGRARGIMDSNMYTERDVEKASLVDVQGMIVNWSAVKTVDIDDTVDEAFFEKINRYSYSRLPVVGGTNTLAANGSTEASDWDGMKIFGFLHVKNLVGLNLIDNDGQKRSFYVRDLPIYPLPIIQETMTVYDLLNMFQLGMSRIAVVIPASPKMPLAQRPDQPGIATNKRTLGRVPRCPSHTGGEADWTGGFLEAAKATIDKAINHDHKDVGISSPKPLGIVTFEDLIDTILQKTSLDERDFFDRHVTFPPTKTRRLGDFAVQRFDNILKVPNYFRTASVSLHPYRQEGSLFHRHVSNNRATTGAMDGADDQSVKKDTSEDTIRKENKHSYLESSYTQNSQGGFHRTEESGSFQGNSLFMSCADVADWRGNPNAMQPSSLLAKIASLPCLRGQKSTASMALVALERRASAGPSRSHIPRITSSSEQRYLAPSKTLVLYKGSADLVLPIASMFCKQSTPAENEDVANEGPPYVNTATSTGFEDDTISLEDAREYVREKSGDTISLSTYFDDEDDFADRSTDVYEAFPSTDGTTQELGIKDESVHVAPKLPTKQYDGFPVELLERNKENHVPNYHSHTFPRMVDFVAHCDDTLDEYKSGEMMRIREQSSHDDRALLPSQRKQLQRSLEPGTRSSSFWF